MIELVNPDDVAGVNRTDDVLDGELLSGESAIIAKSVEKRRREFVTVCACARAGLRIMGVEPIPILHYSQGARFGQADLSAVWRTVAISVPPR